MNKIYSVWVGGTEANNRYLTLKEARNLKKEYLEADYNDVKIRKELKESD